MHVLLIEDDALVASGIQAGLTAYDFVVDHVSNIAEAKGALEAVTSDVVILDRGLPDGDGLVLLEAWRNAGIDIPVLVLTARDGVSDRVAGLRGGADGSLAMACELVEMVVRLEGLLRRAAGR